MTKKKHEGKPARPLPVFREEKPVPVYTQVPLVDETEFIPPHERPLGRKDITDRRTEPRKGQKP